MPVLRKQEADDEVLRATLRRLQGSRHRFCVNLRITLPRKMIVTDPAAVADPRSAAD